MHRKLHVMDIWHDMEIRVDKRSRIGVRSTISRNDFRRMCVIHDALEDMNFTEVRIVRRNIPLSKTDMSMDEVLEKISDKELRNRVLDLIGHMSADTLRKVYLTLLSYSKKELLV